MIYVLLLQENKIYVGYSERSLGERLIEHFNYKGSKWTTIYHPLQVLQVQPGGREQENEMTLRLMNKYGWWNVRGGNWCQVDLNSCPSALLEWQRLKLPTPLRKNTPQSGISNKNSRRREVCARCGRYSHSTSNCFAKSKVTGEVLDFVDTESESSELDDTCCYRCGRNSHFVRDCFAKTDIHGYPI